jgi:hypothetical protein
MTNHFVTFCFNIGRIESEYLIRAAVGLVRSLDHFKNSYTLTIYTNIPELHDTELTSHSSVVLVNSNLDKIVRFYKDFWLNLSCHKFTVIKEHLQSGFAPIWIDLDTIVCKNLNHLTKYDNFFIMHGTNDERPFYLFESRKDLFVKNKDYIQGNIWKLTNELASYFTTLWESFVEKPAFDLQGMYNFAYHLKGMNATMRILGKDFDTDTVNGIDIVNTEKIYSPTIDLLKDSIISDVDGNIIQKSTGKKVQFFTFTFFTLKEFLKHGQFAMFHDEYVKNFFKTCNYY